MHLMANKARLRIGTRGSALARVQAEKARVLIAEATGQDSDIVVITTSGDTIQNQRLSEIGGKGLFTKEIETALTVGKIDLAVHSMKDVATADTKGLEFAAILPREDPRDVWIDRLNRPLKALPAGSTVGTAGLRRQAQILHMRPDLKVKLLRGNVETRLSKLAAGEVDATLLAFAGLQRLDRIDAATNVFSVKDFMPAVAQGALGLQIRSEDLNIRKQLATLNCKDSSICIAAERAFLAALDGSCRTPIAALAEMRDDTLVLEGLLASTNGDIMLRGDIKGSSNAPLELGTRLAARLKNQVPPGAVLWDTP